MMLVDGLYEKLASLPYGFIDKNTNDFMTKPQRKDPLYVIKNMRVQNPKETIKRGGNCWDTSLCISYFAHKNNLPYKFVFTERKDGFHTFCLVKEGGHWYHVEPSDNKYMGVHGPFDNPDKYLKEYVRKNPKLHNGARIERVVSDVDIRDFWNRKDLTPNEVLKRFNSKFAV